MSDADLQELTKRYVIALKRHNHAKGVRLRLEIDLGGVKRRSEETHRALFQMLDMNPESEPLAQARQYAEASKTLDQTEAALAKARAEEEAAADAVQQSFASLKSALPG